MDSIFKEERLRSHQELEAPSRAERKRTRHRIEIQAERRRRQRENLNEDEMKQVTRSCFKGTIRTEETAKRPVYSETIIQQNEATAAVQAVARNRQQEQIFILLGHCTHFH